MSKIASRRSVHRLTRAEQDTIDLWRECGRGKMTMREFAGHTGKTLGWVERALQKWREIESEGRGEAFSSLSKARGAVRMIGTK